MQKQWKKWLFAACLTLPAAALQANMGGETPAPAPFTDLPANGKSTALWLAHQREGNRASDKAQALPGPVMEQVFERYRKSFSHPIPEHFERERFSDDSR